MGHRKRPALICLLCLYPAWACADSGSTRVTLCHNPSGKPGAGHTITIDASAVPAHQAHGDKPGTCPGGADAPSGGATAVFTVCGTGSDTGWQLQISPLGRISQTEASCN